MNRLLHRCGSQYRAWSQQLQNDSPGIPQVIVIFDENMSEKCHFRHLSTFPSPQTFICSVKRTPRVTTGSASCLCRRAISLYQLT
ncbi:hypothetical protein HMPREF0208_03725 [Citrobacter koseri]|nr:hypothetical protein HMPREF3220_02664 [Citrobacter koseri]KXB41356.1 hypothetical protein HMPREF0208_03725 [Citrobacter koseri]